VLSRRRFVAGSLAVAALPGCTFLRDDGVAVVLVNDGHGTREVSAVVDDPAGDGFEESAELPAGSRRVFQNALPYGEPRTATMTASSGDQRVEREVPVEEGVAALVAALDRGGELGVTVRREEG